MPQEQIDSFYACYRAHGDAIFSKIQTNQITVDQSGAYRILKACEEYGIPFSEEDAAYSTIVINNYQQIRTSLPIELSVIVFCIFRLCIPFFPIPEP